MIFKRFYGLIILLILAYPTVAQNRPVVIIGKVLDSIGHVPLESVSILIMGSGQGTTTNNNGVFDLKASGSGKIELQISSLGYKTQAIPLNRLKDTIQIRILLSRNAGLLKEVVITHRSPLLIIQKAIQNIPDCYLSVPHKLNGFYRTFTKKQSEYLQVSEAVFDVYNYGYVKRKNNQLRLIKMRSVIDDQATHGLDIGMKPREVFELDIVKKISSNPIFNKEGLRKHHFELEGTEYYQGHKAYKITFYPKEKLKDVLYEGKVWVDSTTYAFMAFDYKISNENLQFSHFGNAVERMMMNIADVQIFNKGERLQTTYREIGSKWVLSTAVYHNTLGLSSKKKNYNFDANVRVNYLTTNVDTLDQMPFTNKEILGNNKLIEFQDTGIPGDFWKDYTIIFPDFDVEKVGAEIKARNEKFKITH
jgi:hypothetical protein